MFRSFVWPCRKCLFGSKLGTKNVTFRNKYVESDLGNIYYVIINIEA